MSLQNGRFAKSEIHVVKRRLHVQTRLKRCIFFSSLEKKFAAICSLPLVRRLVRVPLPLLCFGTSATNIYKIAKSANDNLTQYKHQNNNLLRQHAIDWSLFRRDSHESRHSNVPSATSKICYKLEKVCVDTGAGKRVLGLTINSVTLELSLNKTKIQKVVSECKNLLNNPQMSILELTRLIGLLTSIFQAVLPARLNSRFLQIQQILSLSENLPYLDKIVLNDNLKIELKWWVQNLELCNGRALIQPYAEVLIQTDASTKGWEQRAMESEQWDVVCSGNEKPHKYLRTFSHKTGYINVLENLKHSS